MNPRRRSLVAAIALASQGTLFSPLAALAQPRDYIELNPPLPVETAGKIEVLEMFWYGVARSVMRFGTGTALALLTRKLTGWLS